jgi:hypothetical protein
VEPRDGREVSKSQKGDEFIRCYLIENLSRVREGSVNFLNALATGNPDLCCVYLG